VTKKAVVLAIKDVSEVIGISLRKPKSSGRPKGIKESHQRRRE
jgi:hypothetical protein